MAAGGTVGSGPGGGEQRGAGCQQAADPHVPAAPERCGREVLLEVLQANEDGHPDGAGRDGGPAQGPRMKSGSQ